VEQQDWVFALKSRVKRSPRLATALFYFTDLAYLRSGPRNAFVRSFPPGARLLNLGAGFKPSPRGFRAMDREAFGGVDLVGDLGAMPLRGASLDGILCESVLEHVPDARAALRELERVVKPGGRVFLTLPFLWQYHAAPHDYWRWTRPGVVRDLAGFEIVELGLIGGPTMALINVAHEWLAITLSFGIAALYRVLYLALMPLLFPLKWLDLIVSRLPNAEKIAALFYVEARKPMAGRPEPASTT
jgi:SAM-dependent methyltransferase